MYAWGVGPGSPGMAPHTSQRTRRLPAIMLAVALVTSPIAAFKPRASDRDAGGAGASGPWPPASPNPPGSGMSYIPIRLYTTFATYHLLFRNIRPFLAIEGEI